MNLDKRIKNGMKPLTCFDVEQARNYVGKKCYLTNDMSFFGDLDDAFEEITGCRGATCDGVIDTLMNINTEYSMIFETTYLRWKFCVPCEWVDENKGKEKEKKYKPYTVLQLSHDIVTRKLSGFITFRRKADRSHDIYILRYNGVFTENKVGYACLGSKTYSMKELFEEYEVKIDNKWQPFGVEIQGEE